MGEEATKVIVPESVLKKQTREEEWELAKKELANAEKKKRSENRKLIFKRAAQYAKEYSDQVCAVCLMSLYLFGMMSYF